MGLYGLHSASVGSEGETERERQREREREGHETAKKAKSWSQLTTPSEFFSPLFLSRRASPLGTAARRKTGLHERGAVAQCGACAAVAQWTPAAGAQWQRQHHCLGLGRPGQAPQPQPQRPRHPRHLCGQSRPAGQTLQKAKQDKGFSIGGDVGRAWRWRQKIQVVVLVSWKAVGR